MERARQSVASEAAVGEDAEDSAVATGLGVTKDLTKAAAVGASVGFGLAHRCQAAGFWFAQKVITAPTMVRHDTPCLCFTLATVIY